ncbi:glutathione S-transferase family protein [Sphingomonas naphthae]|uniref:Glutathione S-transferase family protein n=1 Tax=Sphingomonas naphthae TaxID=1813468 RepID=A0ABY7TPG7_9SPHN|nr:glutathione S-transferase family protein [Sphingomonas naphthae]WCT75127.1 glutathione S-transferase family protein [Sphingomonas naphthae]
MTITLFAYPTRFDLPSSSPFVMKTEIQLRMMGLAYRKAFDGIDRAPRGKLPYIDDGGTIVPDSTAIRRYLEGAYHRDLDAGFDEAQRAVAWTAERLAEDNLFWLMVHARWAIDDNFEAGPARNFDALPDAVRDTARQRQRAKVIAYLDGQGTGRLSDDERRVMADRGYDALSRLIGDKPFLLGDTPCGADASLFAQIAAALIPPFPSHTQNAAARHDNLVRYVDRMMALYYPDFA